MKRIEAGYGFRVCKRQCESSLDDVEMYDSVFLYPGDAIRGISTNSTMYK